MHLGNDGKERATAAGELNPRRGPRHEARAVLTDTVKLWLARDAFQHAGALAFFTLFSMAPLLIIVVSIIGTVYGAEAASGEVSARIASLVGEQAAEAIEETVNRARPQVAGLFPTLLGIGALVFGATTVLAQMQASLNHVWGVRSKPARSGVITFITVRLLSFGMLLIIGFLLLTSLLLSVALTAVLSYASGWVPVPSSLAALLDIALSLVMTSVLLGMLFKVLPDVRLAWRDVRHGAFATAVLFVIGKYLISFYLTRVAPASAYGAAASLVLVLFWVYYSALILFLGTALTRVLVERRVGVVTPKYTAVRVTVEVHET